MQAMEQPGSNFDSDLLLITDTPRFGQWLKSKGVGVRNAKASDIRRGIMLWVRPKGVGTWFSIDVPRTPGARHALTHKHLRSFLAEFLKRPMQDAVRAGNAQLVAVAPAQAVNEAGCSGACASSGKAPKCAGGDKQTRPVPPSPAAAAPLQEAKPVAIGGYLEDLRDDFALHAPLKQRPNEALRDYAARRWEYAQLMIELRP